MKTYRMFVDGKMVDAVEGKTEIDPQSGDGEADREGADGLREGRRPRRRVRGRGLREVGGHDSRRAEPDAPQARRPDRAARRGARAARGGERRQADRARAVGDSVPRRQPALLRRRLPVPGGEGGGRVPRGLHEHDPPRAGRRRRLDRALELPAHDGDLEDRAGARRGQHGRPQALRADAADLAAPRGARRGHLPARRLQRDHRARRAGGRGRWCRHPKVAHGVAHRRRRDRQGDREGGRRDAEEGAPRARRQGAGRDLRRRRPGARRPRHQDGGLRQQRPGLHRGLPALRVAAASTTAARGSRAGGRVGRRRATSTTRTPPWGPSSPRSTGSASPVSSSARRSDGPRPGADRRTTGEGPGFWYQPTVSPTRARRTRSSRRKSSAR